MSFSCSDARARFASYSAEALTSEERRAVREHIAACEACREEAAAADSTLLFAGTAPVEDVSAAEMARILENVRAGVALKQAERRLARPLARRRSGRGEGGRRRAAAIAAAAAVALFTLALPGGLSERAAAPPAPAAAAKAVTPGFARVSAFANGSADGSAESAGTATIYEIAPGAGADEPRVVWIVDRSLDI